MYVISHENTLKNFQLSVGNIQGDVTIVIKTVMVAVYTAEVCMTYKTNG